MRCLITNECARKIKYYTKSTPLEISGWGKSRIDGDDIIIEDVVIFKQKCSGSNTDLEPTGEGSQAAWQHEMTKKGEDLKDWNVWWHSHASMGVFWSGTDDKMVSGMANGNGYLVSIVTNHKGDFKTRFDIYPTDKSPFNYITHMKAADDIETIILPLKSNDTLSDKLYETLKGLIDEFDLDYANAESYYDEQIKAVTKEKTSALKEMEDVFDEKTASLYKQYDEYCEGIIIDDAELEVKIKDEVNQRVSSIYTVIKKETTFSNDHYLKRYGLIEDSIDRAIANKTAEKIGYVDNSKSAKLDRKKAKKERRAQRLADRESSKMQTAFSMGIDGNEDELDDIYSNMFKK